MTPEQLAALSAERDGLKSTLAALTTEVTGLKSQLVSLTAERDGLVAEKAQAALAAEATEKAELIKVALSGEKPRLVPAQKAWAEKQPLASLKEYLDAAAPLSLTQQQSETSNGDGAHGLNQEELAMCSKMGVTAEQFAATKKAQA